MLSAALSLLLHSFHMCLRLTGRTNSFPRPLTPQEETQAVEAMRNGDKQAREKLIMHNMRLVAHVIKKYYCNLSDQEDLLSIGTLGLLKAVDSYKPDRNVKLPTYACKCIQNELFMHFRNQKKRTNELFFSDPLEGDGDSPSLSIEDVLQTQDDTQERLELNEAYEMVACLVDAMEDPRQKRIIKLRYGFDGRVPLTQREVASQMGISRSYVSRIEKKALSELESQLSEA